jgi:ABC-type Zn2+ transport system substrate-binding protein/surface adhesin
MKILKTANYKKAQQYKSDEDIANEFSGMQIRNIEVNGSGKSGWIEISFPEAGEHVGGGASEVTDSWIKYDHNGKIAFDNWYPPEISSQLIQAIEAKIKEVNNPENKWDFNVNNNLKRDDMQMFTPDNVI